jgi:hypothetical protein
MTHVQKATCLIAAVTSMLLPIASPLFAAGPVQVKTVEVDVTLDDITNAAAAARFANIKADLENAIATRLVGRIDEDDGVKIAIDISEVELSSSYSEVFDLADTQLAGRVVVFGTSEYPDTTRYDLTINVDGAKSYFPNGTILASLGPDSSVYYDTLINAFADKVVTSLGQ